MCIGKGHGAEIADLGIAALGAGLGFGAMGMGPMAGMFSGMTAPAGGLGAAGAALAGNALPESEAVGISGAPAALGAHALGNPGLLSSLSSFGSSLSSFGHGLATAQSGIGAAQMVMNMLGLGPQPQAPPAAPMRPPAGPPPMLASQVLQAPSQIGVPPGGAASMVGNRMGTGAPGMGMQGMDPRLLALLMQQRGMA